MPDPDSSPSRALREAFLNRLTVDSVSRDRRRSDYNQAIFDAHEGWQVFNGTDLHMVMAAFDRAVMDLQRAPQNEQYRTQDGA